MKLLRLSQMAMTIGNNNNNRSSNSGSSNKQMLDVQNIGLQPVNIIVVILLIVLSPMLCASWTRAHSFQTGQNNNEMTHTTIYIYIYVAMLIQNDSSCILYAFLLILPFNIDSTTAVDVVYYFSRVFSVVWIKGTFIAMPHKWKKNHSHFISLLPYTKCTTNT